MGNLSVALGEVRIGRDPRLHIVMLNRPKPKHFHCWHLFSKLSEYRIDQYSLAIVRFVL